MSLKSRFKNYCAFTIPELLVGSIVVGFIFTATVTSYIMLDKMWKEDLVLNELARDANTAVDKIIRGVQGNEGLLAAKSIAAPASGASADSVDYTDMNNISRRFYYSGGKLYALGVTDPILSDVLSALFSNVSNTLRIELLVRRYVINKEVKIYLRTQVKPRN